MNRIRWALCLAVLCWPLPMYGQTITPGWPSVIPGTLTLGTATSSGQLVLNGVNPASRSINWRENGLNTWVAGLFGTNSGANAGNDFFLGAYSDAGAFLGNAFTITRSTRAAQFFGSLVAPTLATNTGNLAITNATAGGSIFSAGVGNVTGSHTGSLSYNLFYQTGDNSVVSGSSVLVQMNQTVGGNLFSGGAISLNINQTFGTASPGSNTTFYIGANIGQTASANAGGSDTGNGSSGNLYGLNITPALATGATNFTEQTSAEIDSAIETGASSRRRQNLILALQNDHAVQGANLDTMITIGRTRSASVGSKTLIMLGTEAGLFPSDNSIGAFVDHQYGGAAVSGVNPQLARFIDAQDIYASSFMWRSPGTVIDGSGNYTMGPATITWSSSGLAIDSGGTVGGSPTVTAGGSGFVNGQLVRVLNGLYTATVAAGAITALTPVVNATNTGAGSGAAQTINGDGGTGATATIPWTNATTLSLNPSGNTVVGTGAALATGATSGFLQIGTTTGAPTGTIGGAGKAALIIRTDNHRLCHSEGGGTWYYTDGTACS